MRVSRRARSAFGVIALVVAPVLAGGCAHAPRRAGQAAGRETEPLNLVALRARLEAARTECTDTYAPDEFLTASRRLSRIEKSGAPADEPRSRGLRRDMLRVRESIDEARLLGLSRQAQVREKTAREIERAVDAIARAEADGAAQTAPDELDRARRRLGEAQTAFISSPCSYPEAGSLAAIAAAVADKAGSEAVLARTREDQEKALIAEAEAAARAAAEEEARKQVAAAPPAPPAPAGPAAPPAVDVWTVGRGDSLWKIAGDARVFGDPFLWPVIYHVNRAQIGDPDLIFPGQEFLIRRGLDPVILARAVREARSRIWPVPNYLHDGR